MPVSLAGGPVDRLIELHGVAWCPEPHALELEVTTGSTSTT